MIRLEVIEKKDHTGEPIIANPIPSGMELAHYYVEKLEEAKESKAGLICFEAIPFTEKKSDNFQNINILEKAIMDFLRKQEYPQKVRIVCDSTDAAELYKVVYNFYYPAVKGERLEDDRWD